MSTITKLTVSKNVGGVISATETQNLSDNESIIANPSVPAAQPSTLTVRTDNATGTLTMTNSSHGITTGQRIDLYWAGGQRYGVIVGTVAGTSVPITVGAGTNLPSTTTAISVGIATVVNFGLTGNNLTALVLQPGVGPTNSYFVFNNGSSDVAFVLIGPGVLYIWYAGNGDANLLAGATPTVVYMSHNYVAAAVGGQVAVALTH